MLPLFVLDRQLLFHPETGVARVAFLLATLQALDRDMRQLGGRLLVRFGDPAAELLRLVREGAPLAWWPTPTASGSWGGCGMPG